MTGDIDPETGYLFDLVELKRLIKENIEDRYDHKNLNLECPEFKDENPTAERICYEIWKIMSGLLGDRYDVNIRLWETPRNSVEYPPIS